MSLLANPAFSSITFTANLSSGIRILEGTLSSSATLATRSIAGITNVAYIIDQLTVAPGAVLTIQPGVVIKFLYNYYADNSITVQGALVANATAAQPIVFTSIGDDSYGGDTNNNGGTTSPNKGNWCSIDFTASSLDSLNSMKHCIVRYGGYHYWYVSGQYLQYGMVRDYNAKAVMDSSTIEQSSTSAIGVFGSGYPTIKNTQMNNIVLAPVTISMFANPTFAGITALNVGFMAIGIVPETYSVSNTVPIRNLAGYTNITYLLYGVCTINTGTTITIPAGVVFKGGTWQVNGALAINGTAAQNVVFTDPADDNYGNPFDTNGDGSATSPSILASTNRISFADVSTDSLSALRYTVFRYTDGGIYLQQASPRITHCVFDRTNWGVYLNGVSNPSLDSCWFRNLTYAPLQTSLVSYPRSTLSDSISGTTFRGIGVLHDETLSQDITLPKRSFAGFNNIPYLFQNYTIASNAVLTVAPGVILKFFPGTGIAVNKGLNAIGGSTADSTIVFTDIRDDFYGGDTNADSIATHPTDVYWEGNWSYSNQGWTGISFADQSLDPFCNLTHCVVKYAGIYQTWYNNIYMYGAAIMTYNASPTITYSSLTNNGNGIAAFGSSNPVVNYCDIYNNTDNGVNNVNKSFDIDARWNWWGNNSGPTNISNSGGTGQAVTDSVNYIPFLGSGASNPIEGDVSLNGLVQAYDASLILQFVVNPSGDTLVALQQKVADVSNNGTITAYDASLILQYVVGLISAFPAEMQGDTSKSAMQTKRVIALQKVSNVQLSVENATAHGGDTLVLAITLQNVVGVGSGQLALKYDPSVFSFQKALPGDLTSGYYVSTHSDDKKGTLNIAVAGSNVLKNNGTLAYVAFKVSKDVRGTINSPIEVVKFLANETDMTSIASSGQIKVIGKPTSYSLDQNYPNPFNPSTTIGYELPDDNTQVRLIIYNMTGQITKTLVDLNQNAGVYKVVWNGTNNSGARVSSGVYFYRMTAGKFVQVKKLLLLK